MERSGHVQILVAVLLHTSCPWLMSWQDCFVTLWGGGWRWGGDHGLHIFRIYPNSASTHLPMILMRMIYQGPKFLASSRVLWTTGTRGRREVLDVFGAPTTFLKDPQNLE